MKLCLELLTELNGNSLLANNHVSEAAEFSQCHLRAIQRGG